MTFSLSGCAPETSNSSQVSANQEDENQTLSTFDAIVGGDEVRARKTRVAGAILQMVAIDQSTKGPGSPSLSFSLSKTRCTATLIGGRVALTAAHCIDNFLHRKLFAMRIDPQTSQATSSGWPVIVVGHEINHASASVRAIAVAPDYKKVGGAPVPDIALLLLDRSVQLPSQALRPKLDTTGLVKVGGHVTAMGFGLTKYDLMSSLVDQSPKGLFQKTFRVVNSSKVNWLAKRKTKDTFFMGVDRGEAAGSICQGDSGGPVFGINRDPKSPLIELVGVISRSEAGCSGFSAAVSVASHADWIQRQAAKWQTKLF